MGARRRGGAIGPSTSSSRGAKPNAVPEMPSLRQISKDVQQLLREHALSRGRSTDSKPKKRSIAERIVELGGRKPRGEKRTLAVHLHMTKKKREREQRQLQENLRFGIASAMAGGNKKKKPEEGRVLRCSEGHFRRGVLNVKHLLQDQQPSSSSGQCKPSGAASYRKDSRASAFKRQKGNKNKK